MSDEINDPLALLRAELSSVTPSEEFAAGVRARLADDLEPLRAELAELTASPEFAARVRQQLEQGSQSSWRWLTWRWMAPVGALAAAVMLFMLFKPVERPTPHSLVAVVQPQDPVSAPPAVREPAGEVAASRLVRPRPVKTTTRSQEAPLEVLTNQPTILREWMVRASTAAVSEADDSPAVPVEVRDVAVAPVEVTPVVVKWLVEPPPQPLLPYQLQIIRSGSADAAARSAR